MNMREREQEERLQAEAEAAERQAAPAGGNPAVDQYRLVLRALRREPVEGLPLDFAARIARRVLFAEERGTFEDWMITALMLVMAGGALYYLQPILAKVVAAIDIPLPSLPAPLLVAAAVAVLAAWATEQGLARRK
jgi:hypothetical protein